MSSEPRLPFRARIGRASDLAAIESTFERARAGEWAVRLAARDATLWSNDADVQEKIANRLGWLDAPEHFTTEIPSLEAFGESPVTGAATRVTDWEGTDTIPMWHGDWVYYLSDAGPEHRLNIWRANPSTKAREQVTRFTDFDVRWPAMGPDDGSAGRMVFQHGPDLCALDLGSGAVTVVPVRVPGARARLRNLDEDASESIQSWDISPTGKRALVQGRGDVWTLRFRGKHPVNRFVAFESLEAAVEHHVAFLLGRYRSAVELAMTTGSAEAYVRRCYELRYFTGDPDGYAKSVASLAREYRRTMPADPAPEAPTPPVEALVSLAATVPAPEPQTPRVEAPAAPGQGRSGSRRPRPTHTRQDTLETWL